MESMILTDDTFPAKDEYGNDVFMLVTNSQDIRSTLADISRFDLSEDAGLLYVKNGDAEILEVWYSTRSNPDLGATLYQAYPFDPIEVGQGIVTVNCSECNSLNNAKWDNCCNCRASLPKTEESDMDDEYAWLDGAELLLDGDVRGFDTPFDFAQMVNGAPNWTYDQDACNDLINGWYSDDVDLAEIAHFAANDLLDSAQYTDPETGQIFNVYMDNDIWLVPA